jgi:hypothetical protein
MKLDAKNRKRYADRFRYFASNMAMYFLPDRMADIPWRRFHSRLSDTALEDITRRASYYVKLPGGAEVPEGESFLTGKFKFPFFARHHHSSYFFDIYPHLRMMPDGMRFLYMAEDVDWELPAPTFVKSRPVTAGPSMSAICRMNSIRHFRFVEDEVPYEKKKDIVVSRNEVRDQPWRSRLLEMYCGDPRFDFGQINSDVGRPEWVRPFMSIDEQLGHKFIMCIRGNDVATNLKWVMSSNSIAVMPRPDVESWYMEGLLKGGVHYIEVKPDYSDLPERIDHYLSHPDEAEEIIANAHRWVDRFRDTRIEQQVMREAVCRYFVQTGQTDPEKP